MLAARIRHYGGPEQVRLEETDQPEPKKGEALIRVRAAGVNPVDWKIVGNEFNESEDKLPQTVGQDFAGVVESLNGKADFKKGDRVLGEAWGSYAEYAVVPIKDLVKIPDSLDFETAASIPMPALTAWQIIHQAARLKKDQRILIHGASGAVGSFAVQFAKRLGAYVIGTSSRAAFDHLQNIGIDEVVDYNHEQFQKVLNGVDVVVDSKGGDVQLHSFEVMKKGGILINLVGEINEKAANAAAVKAIEFRMKYDVNHLREILELIDDGEIKVGNAKVFPLTQARETLSLSQEGKLHGKAVLRVE